MVKTETRPSPFSTCSGPALLKLVLGVSGALVHISGRIMPERNKRYLAVGLKNHPLHLVKFFKTGFVQFGQHFLGGQAFTIKNVRIKFPILWPPGQVRR
jgi:hypothetical protein